MGSSYLSTYDRDESIGGEEEGLGSMDGWFSRFAGTERA